MDFNFKTYRFNVNIMDLADYLGIDSMSDPTFKLTGSKIIEWRMRVTPMGYYLGSIEFIVDQVDLMFNWSVYTEYLNEYELMKLQNTPGCTTNDHDVSGGMTVHATIKNGFKLSFEKVNLTESSAYEFEPEEVDIYLTEKVIVIR